MKKSLDDNDLDIETGEVKKKGGGRAKPKKEVWPANTPPSSGVQTPTTQAGLMPNSGPGGVQNPAAPGGLMPNNGPGGMQNPSTPGGLWPNSGPGGMQNPATPGSFMPNSGPGLVQNPATPGGFMPNNGPSGAQNSPIVTSMMTNSAPGPQNPAAPGGLMSSTGPIGAQNSPSSAGLVANSGPGSSGQAGTTGQVPNAGPSGLGNQSVGTMGSAMDQGNSVPPKVPTPTPNIISVPGPGEATPPSQIPNCVPGPPPSSTPSQGPVFPPSRVAEPSITYDWANDIMKDYVPGLLENGGKMLLLLRLIEESLREGDKILVFSQSLFTLGLIEEFLSKYKVPRPEVDEYWCKNKNYYRLDGSTSSTDRERLINQFNHDPSKWVFLLSTRAGSLGVNLVGANRVVVMDASWNPCHDCQAICRVYRFGQKKPSFIYRLVTDNTMEKKIYDRQVNKQGMSDRVVDELNPQNQFRKGDVTKLIAYEDKEFPVLDFSACEEEYGHDSCMVSVLHEDGHWLTEKPFTHESLLIDRKELKLTMKEKRLAKQSYVMEKRLNVSYSRPSYAAYYPKGQPYQGMIRGRGINRPIASVKPMVSTPVPMKPKIVAAPQVLKPGVSVHQVLTTTEIVLPGTNTTTDSGVSEPKKIPAGQQVLVIRTPKGVYIRTPDGKIFAVRSKPMANSTSPLDTLANTGSTGASAGSTTIVTTTMTGSNRNPTGVTVIRPSVPLTTKPLTIIRSGPGQIRTVIPVTIGSKSVSTTTAAIKAPILQSDKVNALLKNGAQIRVVTPSGDSKAGVNSLAALQNLSKGGAKVISNSPAFSGGSLVTKKILPKPVAGVETIKNVSLPVSTSINESKSNSDSRIEALLEGSDSSSDSVGEKTVTSKSDSSWNLPPINMQALKLPKQLSDSATEESAINKRSEQKKTLSNQSIGGSGGDGSSDGSTSRPKFTLSESPSLSSMSDFSESQSPKVLQQSHPPPATKPLQSSDAALSTRPSDIDLHELQLKSNPNSSAQLSQMQTDPLGQPDTQRLFQSKSQSSFSRQSQSNFSNNTQATSFDMPAVNATKPIQQQQQLQQQQQQQKQQQKRQRKQQRQQSQSMANMAAPTSQSNNRGIFNPGLPNASHSSNSMNNMMSSNSMNNVNNSVNSVVPGNTSVPNSMLGGSTASSMGMGGNNMISNTAGQVMGQNSQMPAQDSYMHSGNNSFMGNEFSGNMSGAMMNSNTSMGTDSSQQGMSSGMQNKDNSLMGLADFGNLQNNSSFLSELNFSETDDNFLSQLEDTSAPGSSMATDSSGVSGSQMMYSNNNMAGGSVQNMGRQIQGGGTGGGFQQQNQMHSSVNMDQNMFSNQQNSGFFQGYNNQFQGNTGYGNNPAMGMSQAGYPGGSMYPMGGMMQPNMYGYPPFAPYPYPPMMPPMPYYPMPFQPQYGNQGNNMGSQQPQQQQPGGNMGMGMNQPQGDNSMQTGATSSGMGDNVGMH